RTHQGQKKMLNPLSKCYRPLKFFGIHVSNLFQERSVKRSRLEHALLRPLTAAPRNDTGAPVPLRGIFVELIAAIQLSHQPIVLYRATPSAFCFGLAGHVFLLILPVFSSRLSAQIIRVKRDGLIPADET
ncbi:MAG TPA: hypothetical protein VFX82_14460, partial [Desulfobacterales bacterium]|nr:hypothetical protein [Desulfobacterales bacterium]